LRFFSPQRRGVRRVGEEWAESRGQRAVSRGQGAEGSEQRAGGIADFGLIGAKSKEHGAGGSGQGSGETEQ
jgi:hypothetical protein